MDMAIEFVIIGIIAGMAAGAIYELYKKVYKLMNEQ